MLRRSYSEVWALEFSVLPVTEHSKQRQRIREDLARLQTLPIKATAEWLDFLKDAYQESGAPEAQVQAIEDRILKEFPHSDEAEMIRYHRWNDEHPRPSADASAGDWQQYMRLALPAFELADLQGKVWKMKSLEGKKVLINIWATWCGPCQSELPHLEKLYQQVKNRTDVAILTLNFDEDLGQVEPFIRKKGYTFPVLPAYSFLANKIDVNSIPRNWLIDPSGKWKWEQIGFDSTEPDWEKSMLTRLESTN